MTTGTTRIVNDLAAIIREADGNNRLRPEPLAMSIEDGLQDLDIYTVEWKPLAAFIARTNPDKTLSVRALAELIVAEFNLGDA